MRLTPPRRAKRRIAGFVTCARLASAAASGASLQFFYEDTHTIEPRLARSVTRLRSTLYARFREAATCRTLGLYYALERRGRARPPCLRSGAAARAPLRTPATLSRTILRCRFAPPLPSPFPPLPLALMLARWHAGSCSSRARAGRRRCTEQHAVRRGPCASATCIRDSPNGRAMPWKLFGTHFLPALRSHQARARFARQSECETRQRDSPRRKPVPLQRRSGTGNEGSSQQLSSEHEMRKSTCDKRETAAALDRLCGPPRDEER